MNCKICGDVTVKIFKAKVLRKYDVDYFQCTSCGFAQTEKEYWLSEAYRNSMNLADTGIMSRNDRMTKITTSIICLFLDSNAQFLDFAGGVGVFTRSMRDVGFDYYWDDPYTTNIAARGFEGDLHRKYEAVTTFESFEHFENPIAEIEKLLQLSDTIILTTNLISIPAPKHKEWWYYCSDHGQHIAFYTTKTFGEIAKQFGLKYYNTKNVHIITKRELGVSAKLLFMLPFAKHLLYGAFFLFNPFLKSKSMSDMFHFFERKVD
jgi:hypothetical protein